MNKQKIKVRKHETICTYNFLPICILLPMQLKRGEEQLNEEGTQILQEYQQAVQLVERENVQHFHQRENLVVDCLVEDHSQKRQNKTSRLGFRLSKLKEIQARRIDQADLRGVEKLLDDDFRGNSIFVVVCKERVGLLKCALHFSNSGYSV